MNASGRRLIYNNDMSFILGNALHGGRPLTIEDVRDHVDLVADSQVTTFLICTNASMPDYPSAVERPVGCPPADADVERGSTMAERLIQRGATIRKLAEQGTDIISICVERARERGMEAFATTRMNDLHHHDTSIRDPLRQGDFWLGHPECRVGEHPGRCADGALNFACEPVRRYKLDLIREICERFDLDGLELDFMRMPVYFPFNEGEAHLEAMTEFVRDASEIARAAGERRGRPLRLVARVPRSIAHARWIGLDPGEWARRGWIDFLTASAYYIDDPALPLADFRRELDGAGIPVYANVDRRVLRPNCNELRSHDLYRAAAAYVHEAGADGIYLFNHFFAPPAPTASMGKSSGQEPNSIWERPPGLGPARSLLEELGHPETLRAKNKRYALATDIEEYGYLHPRDLPWYDLATDIGENGCAYPRDLPSHVATGKTEAFEYAVADDPDADEPEWAALCVRFKGGGDPEFELNGQALAETDEATVAAVFPSEWEVAEDEVFRTYDVPVSALKKGRNSLRLTAGESGLELLQADLCLCFDAAAANASQA